MSIRQYIMIGAIVLVFITTSDGFSFLLTKSYRPGFQRIHMSSDSNSETFGSPSAALTEVPPTTDEIEQSPAGSASSTNQRMKDQAAKLRREAAELEIAMREEAREKGLSQEVIDQLIPMRNQDTKPREAKKKGEGMVAVADVAAVATLTPSEVRAKLGYLNTGDAVRITSELDRLKSRGALRLWNCKDVSKASFAANSLQLTSKTGIEPISLRLDAVGFEYQKVFVTALGIATVLGLASSFVGGQIGFLLGYASALFPILLVGVGSIAPQLIGDVLNKFKYATDETEKKKYIRGNAAKFLVGYIMGLPMASFSVGGDSNRVEFFQIRPSAANIKDAGKSDQQMFRQKSKFTQADIAPISVTCVAGPTAECMEYTVAGGSNPADVNLLYELMNAIEPALSPDKVQNHIRWSVLMAHTVLKDHQGELERLTEAFAKGSSLEECIAIMEGKKQ